MRNTKSRRAFTLIEILVTCLVLGVVLGAVVPFSYAAYQKMLFAKEVAQIESVIRQKKLQALMKEEDLPLQITWEGTMLFNEQEVDVLDLQFFCNGSVRPEGTLVLSRGVYVHTKNIP